MDNPQAMKFRTDYYSANMADWYDCFSVYRDRPDVPFFVEEAVASGGPVLEVACGTGRILVPTARAGVSIVGLDFSEHMLRICTEKLANEPAEVQARAQILRGDMRDFSLNQKFALTTLPFRPFQHLLTVEEQLACLSCIHRHLEPGGRLIIDLFDPSLQRLAAETPTPEVDEGEPFTLADGCKVQRRARTVNYDRFAQVLHIEFLYDLTHIDGRTERKVEPLTMRCFFRYEAEHLLVRAGFEIVDLFADFDRNPFGSIDPGQLIFIVRKPN